MKIRTRLTFWYAAILIGSLLLIGSGTFREILEQLRHEHRTQPAEHALGEAGEMIFQIGLPAVLLGLLGGWWLTRRALAPVTRLTEAVEKIHDHNLREQLPRTGNGDELDRLTEVFNTMTTRLDGSFQRIREFGLHASHELKTPLAILHGEMETSLTDPALPAAQRERLASQLDEIQRLARIVDGLTLLAKADAGQIALHLEPLSFDEIARDVFADAQILAQARNISVTLVDTKPLTVRGDRHRLRQLLLNLADNAIKYCDAGGTVQFELRAVDSLVEFTLTNSGPGIPAEQLPRVFEPFYRGDASHHRGVDGCGLGLSIARWIATAHAGILQITSTPGRTSAIVRLPQAVK
ncbi:MAG TPA: ATP-binding protein [Dongiaceae bacterium]|nr:ATP-binding protein [Dongiaceae bacterium]